jgi:hypothetical protein
VCHVNAKTLARGVASAGDTEALRVDAKPAGASRYATKEGGCSAYQSTFNSTGLKVCMVARSLTQGVFAHGKTAY